MCVQNQNRHLVNRNQVEVSLVMNAVLLQSFGEEPMKVRQESVQLKAINRGKCNYALRVDFDFNHFNQHLICRLCYLLTFAFLWCCMASPIFVNGDSKISAAGLRFTIESLAIVELAIAVPSECPHTTIRLYGTSCSRSRPSDSKFDSHA